jgi:alpha-methylacyl-CoA racemase
MGADVIRIERTGRGSEFSEAESGFSILNRNRRSIALNLKSDAGRDIALRLVKSADAVIEGFRPGVMERLGLGPQDCQSANPRLIYGRVTGWGREGPLAPRAGHDINYLALSGALDAIGPRGGAPLPPLNLLADYGGGGMYLAFGLVCALLEASRSGSGQVVDVAMTDAVASLMTVIQGLAQAGQWKEERGSNLLDSGAPFYTTYETSDGRYMAVGPIEPEFHAQWLELLGLPPQRAGVLTHPDTWPQTKESIQAVFRMRTQAAWCAIFDGSDACVSPVLSLSEAPDHPHHQARGTYVKFGGKLQAAPAPRFSRTPGTLRSEPPLPGADAVQILQELNISSADINDLVHQGAVVLL